MIAVLREGFWGGAGEILPLNAGGMTVPNTLKCLALSASPRKDGNTALLARLALGACAEAGCDVEFLYLVDFRYEPCRACEGCYATGRCVVPDDAGVLYEKILGADRLIFAAPVFSMGICAQAKMLIDRAQQFWAVKYLLGRRVVGDDRPERRGIFISCAGTTLPGVFDGTVRVARYFFKMLEIRLQAALCYAGVEGRGEIFNNKAALEEVVAQGRLLAL